MTQPKMLVMAGADTLRGMRWLENRFPQGTWQARALLLHVPGGELDAVLWAEAIRDEAREEGFRLSFGVGITAAWAEEAHERALDLGGDMTVAHSNLLRAA